MNHYQVSEALNVMSYSFWWCFNVLPAYHVNVVGEM
jgi:hypothetical protein